MRRDPLLSLALLALGMHDPLVHDLGTVLCVGSDGHVEIEGSMAAGCGDRAARRHDDSLLGMESHCGSCVDLPLPCGDATTGTQPPITGPLVSAVGAPLGFAPDARIGATPPRQLAGPPTELAALRTVQLLI